MSVVAVPGAALHVVSVGPEQARPIVVLHGGPGEAHDCLRPWLDALATAERRVVYYDQRGGGASPLAAGNEPGGVEDHLADLEAIRDHLGLARLDLLGFSWGALLALRYAMTHRDRLARLAILSPVPTHAAGYEAVRGALARAAARPEVIALGARLAPVARSDGEAARRARFAMRVAPCFADPERALDLAPVEARPEAAAKVEASLGELDLRPAIAALRGLPALVISGREDPVSAIAAGEIAALLGAPHEAIAGAGHAVFAEAERPCLEALARFFDRSER